MTRQTILAAIVFLFASFLLILAIKVTCGYLAQATVDAFLQVQQEDEQAFIQSYRDSRGE